ncbi:hypothetical protein HPB47_006118 [Ixodes persulcatus]|uniref:Uncharacterized protein n=1 Tax=Ixodes persulcatus TaxID=34615 RepID=A0AC60PB77_IXOPE|nr:hypothetical protein HPB47_006118 [Ixodes persulcatus]
MTLTRRKDNVTPSTQRIKTLGDVKVPPDICKSLARGPKFCLEPDVSPQESVTLTKKVVYMAAEVDHPRCISECVDPLQCSRREQQRKKRDGAPKSGPKPDDPGERSGMGNRKGEARHRDTTPDLAFVRNVKGAEWINPLEDLDSDYFVAALTVIAGPGKPKSRRIRITEWDAFRGFLEDFEEEDIENIEKWTEEVRSCAEHTTKNIPEEANVLTADSKLQHM